MLFSDKNILFSLTIAIHFVTHLIVAIKSHTLNIEGCTATVYITKIQSFESCQMISGEKPGYKATRPQVLALSMADLLCVHCQF